MTTPYRPPIKGTMTEVPWLTLVHQADPDFERKKRREVEYVTSGNRVFFGDPAHRGAYADD